MTKNFAKVLSWWLCILEVFAFLCCFIHWCSLRCRETRWSTATKCPQQIRSSHKVNPDDVLPVCSDSFCLLVCDLSIYLFFNLSVSHCLTETSTRGVTLVPKMALDVMSCEVIRMLQLTDSCIVPISYQVPRKVCVWAVKWFTHTNSVQVHNVCV